MLCNTGSSSSDKDPPFLIWFKVLEELLYCANKIEHEQKWNRHFFLDLAQGIEGIEMMLIFKHNM